MSNDPRAVGDPVASLAGDLDGHRADIETIPAALKNALAGRYVVERMLGRGGMATVYLARDERHRRQVAIKVLRADLVRELGSERFLREIEIAAGLQHQNILPVYDSGETDGLLYYIMPFIAGESLQERLEREHQLPLSAIATIADDVSHALDYAHAHGIVHRDIKPGNILLGESHAVVSDFGVAWAIAAGSERLTSSGLVVGTTRYMSPEQASGDPTIDGRSDVYSLGCVVFEMLVGEPPFTGPTPQAVIAKHMQASIPDARVVRPTIGAETQQVLATALAKVPADRFATAGEFVLALHRSLSAMHVRRRRRRIAIGGSATFLLPVIGLLLRFVMGPSGENAQPDATNLATDQPRVAVLYFDDLTQDSSLGHIAEGLTEELIHELSGVNAFRVVSKGGVKQFRGRQAPFDSMVRVLGASTIVDGSLQRAGDELRVMVHFIDAITNTNVDRISIQRPISEFVTLEREVAQQVAIALRRRLGREVLLRGEIKGTASSTAAELVLKSKRFREDAEVLADRPHPADRRTALAALDRADSLLALAQAADPRWLRPVLERGWVSHRRARLLQGAARFEAAERGLAHARVAMLSASTSAEALELRGTLRWFVAREMDTSAAQPQQLNEAEADLRAALNRDSSRATAWEALSALLLRKGNFAEADIAAERALREDAYLSDARAIYERLFYSAVWNGNNSRAGEWCKRGRLSFPGYWRFVECELTLLRENVDEKPNDQHAWALVRELERLYSVDQAKVDGNHYSLIYWRVVAAAISARAGKRDIAWAEIARAKRATEGDSLLRLDLMYDEAYLRLVLGQRDRAEELLRELVRVRPGSRAILARDPLFRDLPLSWLRDEATQ